MAGRSIEKKNDPRPFFVPTWLGCDIHCLFCVLFWSLYYFILRRISANDLFLCIVARCCHRSRIVFARDVQCAFGSLRSKKKTRTQRYPSRKERSRSASIKSSVVSCAFGLVRGVHAPSGVGPPQCMMTVCDRHPRTHTIETHTKHKRTPTRNFTPYPHILAPRHSMPPWPNTPTPPTPTHALQPNTLTTPNPRQTEELQHDG